jgi:hypothetical protein
MSNRSPSQHVPDCPYRSAYVRDLLRIMKPYRPETEPPVKNHLTSETAISCSVQPFRTDSAATVRVLLQSRESLLFFMAPDSWTDDVRSAADLKNVVNAVDFVVKNHLHGIDVIMHFDNPVHDLRLPLNY